MHAHKIVGRVVCLVGMTGGGRPRRLQGSKIRGYFYFQLLAFPAFSCLCDQCVVGKGEDAKGDVAVSLVAYSSNCRFC